MEPKAQRSAKTIVNFIYSVIASVLAIRFVFRLLDANVTGFVDFLYDITRPLIAPFQAIFDNPAAGNGSVFDSAAVVAILIYGLIAWGLNALVETVGTVAEKQPQTKQSTKKTTTDDK